MVNIQNVMSVIFVFILKLRDWDEKVPSELKELFEKIGDVETRKTSPPPTEEEKAKRPKGAPLMPSTDNCGLQEFFNDLCDHDFQTFSATSEVRQERDDVALRFMACRRNEINWEDIRPFELMHNACGLVCSMAKGYRATVYDNPYIKTSRPVNPEERALSINVINPLWEAKKARHQILIKDDGEVAYE